MKKILLKSELIILFLSFSLYTYPQCKILNKVSPDGSMQYYMETVNFYWTKNKSLTGCIVTDRESYFLEMHPVPVPEKSVGKKLKNDLEIVLSDGKSYNLKHYDTHYLNDDSVMTMLFLIDEEDIARLTNFEVNEAKFDMGAEGIRTYVFKLHKLALKEQLSCFMDEEKNKAKKK